MDILQYGNLVLMFGKDSYTKWLIIFWFKIIRVLYKCKIVVSEDLELVLFFYNSLKIDTRGSLHVVDPNKLFDFYLVNKPLLVLNSIQRTDGQRISQIIYSSRNNF